MNYVIELMEEQINGFDGFDGLDMDLISVFHMDIDWIWIYGSVEDGLWIGYGSRFQSIRPHWLHFIEPYKTSYFQLYKPMAISATIPVITAENERSFSCLKRTKTYLRSIMNHERLGDLGINRQRTSIIDLEDIADAFASLSERRIALN